ncbi:hypothetical protein PybrP1_006881 [[Pythium] brassicae (nom. inval.)]|nr:hypothetical protein PybrP1_006881 [[Pythium] brassicae (nom. inval.)]
MRRSERISTPNRHTRDDDDDDEYEEGEEEDEEEDDDDEEFSMSDDDHRGGARLRARGVRRHPPPPPPQSQRKKRKIISISDSDSSEPEGTRVKSTATRPAPHSAAAKVREVLNRSGAGAGQPKSILKRASKYTVAPPDAGIAATKRARPAEAKAAGDGPMKAAAAEDLSESHRRPTKQRVQRLGDGPEPTCGAKPSAGSSSSTGGAPPTLTSALSTNTLDHFFEEILEWDFYEALVKESQKDYAFSDANDGSEEGEVEQIAKVPSQFQSYDHYFSVWKPLALQEVQAQVLNNVATDTPTPVPVSATGFGATYISKTCKVRVEVNKQMATRHALQQIDGLYVNDLVLISPSRRFLQDADAACKALSGKAGAAAPSNDAPEPPSPSQPPTGMLAIVTSSRMSREGLTMLALSSRWNAIDKPDELFLYKLNNLVTSIREFRALCDCRDYRLMSLLLSGQHRMGSMRLDSLGAEYVRWLTRTFNDSQLEAITAAATSDGFTLIKGPPGTGKTTTLKGLLNSLHLREYSRYYNAVLDVARRPDHETNKAWEAIGNEKPHILVTAPSNAAVDNIVGKVIEEGFCDGEGRRYFPKISTKVRSVGLDEQIDQICGQPMEVIEHKWSSPSSPTLYPGAPPEPPSPSILPAPSPAAYSSAMKRELHDASSGDVNILNVKAAVHHKAGDEEDEDEAFPVSYGQPAKSFNNEETNKAFSAFFGDGNSEDEDEPLPVKLEQLPSAVDHLNRLNVGDGDDEDTDEDEPLPNGSRAVSARPTPSPPSPDAKSDEQKAPSTAFAAAKEELKQISAPIDYTRYQKYRELAQRINMCLEVLSETKLELQRYQFARTAANERGKLSQSMRQSLEVSFLDTAHIVFTTLSSAGVAALDASSRYDVLVVDEAAQAVELSTIIPMKYVTCMRCAGVRQLSATVFSRTSGQSLYERSLFERIETCGHPVHMLRTQYRSHPLISDFPRHYFYGGKLQDGENVKNDVYDKPYHHLGAAFMPLTFWNLLSSRESSSRSMSRSNAGEAELAVNLYLTLKNSCPPDAIAGKVGMITPYSQQMEELRTRFRRALGERFDQEVEINTVDGFQGREKDIIILSTVRADPKGGVGFLNDIRRMNVALTRAKFACYGQAKRQALSLSSVVADLNSLCLTELHLKASRRSSRTRWAQDGEGEEEDTTGCAGVDAEDAVVA